jgi:hypothetical protein
MTQTCSAAYEKKEMQTTKGANTAQSTPGGHKEAPGLFIYQIQ